MSRPETYPASTIDARFDAVDAKFDAAHSKIEAVRQELEADIRAVEGKVDALRGEMKVWLLVLGLLVTPVLTNLGGRATAALWPMPNQAVPSQK